MVTLILMLFLAQEGKARNWSQTWVGGTKEVCGAEQKVGQSSTGKSHLICRMTNARQA
jgi:hypothetical protein